MITQKNQIPNLDFSKKYNAEHATHYFTKHKKGWLRKLSNWREVQIARKAFRYIGSPQAVLDLPCGTGRFWEMLTRENNKYIFAGDNSADMLKNGLVSRTKKNCRQIRPFQASAFAIPLKNNAVESIFCIRLLHHIGKIKDRKILLQELARVTSDYIIISLWVDGNFKSRQRAVHEKSRGKKCFQNRFCNSRKNIEAEFSQAGLAIVKHIDFLKFFSMWRIYVLKKNK